MPTENSNRDRAVLREGQYRCLTVKPDAKWPRFQLQLRPGLTFGEAKRAAQATIKDPGVDVSLLSQFSYDAATGLVDTRINRRT